MDSTGVAFERSAVDPGLRHRGNQRETELRSYLLDARLTPDNNLAENAIRPVGIWRKNFLFAGSLDTVG